MTDPGPSCSSAPEGEADRRQKFATALGARSMVLSVAVAQNPAGNLKPAKDKSTERIDGIIALIMAIGRALVAPGE